MQFAFWGATALIVYTYFVYPAVLLLLKGESREHRPIAGSLPSVSVIIAARNEESLIAAKIRNVLACDYPGDMLEIVLVTDGCTDSTAQRAREVADSRLQIIENSHGLGKSRRLNEGVAAAKHDVLVFMDARQEIEPHAITALVQALIGRKVGAVSGLLVLRKSEGNAFASAMDAYWRYETAIRAAESEFRGQVGVTGALWAMRKRDYVSMPDGLILDDVWVPMQLAMKGMRVALVPTAYAFDQPSADAAQERRRKIRTMSGNWQLIQLQPTLIAPWHNPLFFEYVSHKVLRLVVPFCLCIALVASAGLASSSAFYSIALAGQLAIYLVAALGATRLGSRFPAARAASAFLKLNWYAVVGLFAHLSSRKTPTWK
jgi:cellulose synthase/poly-beta-1,6-N-acetylglucosamine synthase-like glycosyltransferase